MTFTRLSIGEPRLKGVPRGGVPCAHPVRRGANILTGGGFESTIGQGPGGDEIPYGPSFVGFPNGFPWLRYSDESVAGTPNGMWWSFDSSAASGWSVSTANPRTGTYHLRQTLAAETSFPWLHASNFFVCRDRYEANFWQVAATAVVDPGDLWEISFYAMASTLTQTNGYSVDAIYAPEASDSDDYTTTVIDHQVLTTSYAEFTGGETVPDEATTGFTAPYLLFVSIQNRWIGNSGTVTIDLDDVTLSVL